MSFGLALAGGGIKGAAHIGVLKALEEFKLKPSCIAGTSAGSIVAGLYALGFTIEELENIVQHLSKKGFNILDPNYKKIIKSIFEFFIHKSISLSGLIKGNKLESYLCEITENINIKELKTRLIIPAVDLNTGYTVAYTNSLAGLKKIDNVIWKNDIRLGTAMHASSSIPAIFEPKIIDTMCLVDGGITDVLPIDLLLATGETNIVAVDISEKYEMPENYGILEVSAHSISLMRDYFLKYKQTYNNISIKPKLPDKSDLFTFELMDECMKNGYDAAKNVITKNISLFY